LVPNSVPNATTRFCGHVIDVELDLMVAAGAREEKPANAVLPHVADCHGRPEDP
jgi:hypothetical protein